MEDHPQKKQYLSTLLPSLAKALIKVSPLPVTVYDGKGTINCRGKGKCDHPLLQASLIAQPSKEVGET